MSGEGQEDEDFDETKESLEMLVTSCPELEKLEDKLSEFNLFEALKIYKAERVHSSFLRWLLDPKETHGLGDYFLKKFLKRVIQKNKSDLPLEISPVDIDTMDLSNCSVETDEPFISKRQGDISIVDEQNKFYVLIENKIFSPEAKDQTSNYVEDAKNNHPDCKRLLIFLTPYGLEPEAKEFLIFDYSDIRAILEEIIDSKSGSIGEAQMLLIKQYNKNMGVNILEESEIEKLCLKIYNKHKKAIDKIREYMPTNKQTYKTLGENVIKQLGEEWKYHPTNGYCQIYKKMWAKKCKSIGAGVPFLHYEFSGAGSGELRADIHIEAWGVEEEYEKVKKYLGNTPFNNYKGVDLSRRQVVYKKIVAKNLGEEQDKKVQKSADEMATLIKETAKYIDEAVANM